MMSVVNAFDRAALATKQEDAISAWVSFVAAVLELLQSYHSAQIIQQTERGIVVKGRAMNAPGDIFRLRTVSVTAELVAGEVVIRCLIQRWSEPAKDQPITIDQEVPIDLRIDGPRLLWGTKSLTPFESAEKILVEAFSG